MVPDSGQEWSDVDSYLLLGWVWVSSRFALALATTLVSLRAGQVGEANTANPWLTPFWIGIMALTVFNGALIIQRNLRQGEMPSTAALGAGALLDVFWVLGGYVMTGLAPLPFPAFIVALIALHGALLPLRFTMLFSALLAISVAILQSLSTNVGARGISTSGQLVFVLGLGVVAGVVGSRLRAAVWAVFRLRRAILGLSGTHEATVKALPLGMIVLRETGEVERSMGKLEGILENMELEKIHQLLVSLDGRYVEAIKIAEGQGESLMSTDGQEAWVEWSISKRVLPDVSVLDTTALTADLPKIIKRDLTLPEVVRTVVLLRDRSDLHRAQAAERTASEAKHLAAMSAALAHELRNPLAALRSAAEQLANEQTLAPEDRNILGQIVKRESERLNRFLGDFLAYARLDVSPGRKAPVSEGIREALELVRQSYPVWIIKEKVLEGGPVVSVDLVIRVIANLLINAIQHSGAGEAVELEAKVEEEGAKYTVSVRDFGPGIPVSERERIFTPFYTTRTGGNGLGLSMAARAAGLLGGRIWAMTPPGCRDQGEGIIFKLQLPLEIEKR